MKKWNVLSKYNPNEDFINTLLHNRGVDNVGEFISPPSISEYFSRFPKEFKESLKKAKEIIEDAIKEGRSIVIFGDYDSDGINATAIMHRTLKNDLNYENVSYFIPNRFNNGYGLSKSAIEKILAFLPCNKPENQKCLFITVDTGITAVNEVAYLKELGHKVIITDHHQPPEVLPQADCIVLNTQVVGATVAWILSRILGSKNNDYIAYSAVATCTDLIPLVDFNRSLLVRGLDILNKNPPLCYKKMFESSGRKEVPITTYELGWIIGPRINASGRLEDADKSIRLLLSDNEEEAVELSKELNDLNIERQNTTFDLFEKVSDLYGENPPKLLFAADKDFHEGINGLVAAKLTQKYNRPSIVVSIDNGTGKGSARSIKGFNMIEFLRKYKDLMDDVGGHVMAAGFVVPTKNVEELKRRMTEDAEKEISDDLLVGSLDIDMEIPVNIINLDFVEELEKLAPFGMGNNEPLFISKNLGVADVSKIGAEGNHLKINFYENGVYYKGIYFNGAEEYANLKMGDQVDVVYYLKKNEFNGKIYVDLNIKDLKIL